ncbi:hypothetical protein D3C76_1396650 [compost metagenome]
MSTFTRKNLDSAHQDTRRVNGIQDADPKGMCGAVGDNLQRIALSSDMRKGEARHGLNRKFQSS